MKHFSLFLFLSAVITAEPAYAGTCTSPAGNEADIIYNQNYHSYQFCNGTSWIAYGGGALCAPASNGYAPTTPSGVGYFVLTKTTYTGNFTGFQNLQAADSDCLTDLTTNTGWKGYATANANGQLIATKVHAFMCNGEYCNNPLPLTTYYFSNANNSLAGGAFFTTDSYGDGPQDSADWGAANYFSGAYTYWSNRNINNGDSIWATTPLCNYNPSCNCSDWSTTFGFGAVGVTTAESHDRWGWGPFGGDEAIACSTSLRLICFVDP